MPTPRPFLRTASCAALAVGLTACSGPTEFQSAEKLKTLLESNGADCPEPHTLGGYQGFECENVTAFWGIDNNGPYPRRPADHPLKGKYTNLGQRAIVEDNWMIYAVDSGEGMEPGNEIVNRVAEQTHTKAIDAHWDY